MNSFRRTGILARQIMGSMGPRPSDPFRGGGAEQRLPLKNIKLVIICHFRTEPLIVIICHFRTEPTIACHYLLQTGLVLLSLFAILRHFLTLLEFCSTTVVSL